MNFVEFIKMDCKEYGVKCDLRNTKFVRIEKGIRGSGYFDENVPTLVCSMNRPDSLEILVHEYAHFTQWREKIPLWTNSIDSFGKVDEWLKGKRIKNIEYHINQCRDLELDNEKRAVNIIKKFKLQIDLDHYHRKANAYIYSYNYIKESRRWSKPQNSPYSNKRLISLMPNSFNNDYEVLPEWVREVFVEEGI